MRMKIAKGFLFTGFSLQIILGISYMAVSLCCGGTNPLGLAFHGFMATVVVLLQCFCALVAGYYLMGVLHSCKIPEKKWRELPQKMLLFESLALFTFPMALQCHLSISPYSFAGSLLLAQLSFGILFLNRGWDFRLYAGCGICYVLLALLLPEYILLGAIVPVVVLLLRLPAIQKKGKQFLSLFLMLMAFLGMIFGARNLADFGENPYTTEEIAYHLCARTSGSTIQSDYVVWPDEVKEVLQDKIMEISCYPGNMEQVLKPLLASHFEEAKRKDLYLQMAEYAFATHRSVVIRQMGWDALGYAVTPLILPLQLKGDAYASYSGRNYDFMRSHAPNLTKYLVRYSCLWTVFEWICGFVLLICGIWRKEICLRKSAGFWMTCLTAGCIVLIYTLSGAGIMDYRCTAVVNVLWNAGILMLGCLPRKELHGEMKRN